MGLGKQFEFVRVRSTNECTVCDLCGRVDLKATIQLISIDRETGDRDEVYYGAGCAKKALGWGPGMTVKRFEKAAMAKREALAIAAEKATAKKVFAAWRAKWGPDDNYKKMIAAGDKAGMKAWNEELAACWQASIDARNAILNAPVAI